MNSKPKITLLKPSDLEIATRFANDVIDDEFFHHFEHHMPCDMMNNEWQVYVIKYDEQIAAWGQVQLFVEPRKRHVIRIGLIVHPQFRNVGFGSVMLDHIVKTWDCCPKITATVASNNCIMLKMFVERGFEVEGRFVDEERVGKNSINIYSLAKFKGAL